MFILFSAFVADSHLSVEGMRYLSELLAANSTIETLDFSHSCCSCVTGMLDFVCHQVLQYCSVIELCSSSFSVEKLSDDAVEVLINGLVSNKSVTILNLRGMH